MDPTEDLEMGPQPAQVDAAKPAPDENRSDVNQTAQNPTTEHAESEISSDESDPDVASIEDSQVYVVDFTRTPDGKCSYRETLHKELDEFESSLQSEEARYTPGYHEAQQLCITTPSRLRRECTKNYLNRRQISQELIEDFIERQDHAILAFFFIPLTFVAGIFGMNLKEMADLSIWIWAVTSAVLLLASYIVLYYTEVRGNLATWKTRRKARRMLR
ncbi:hypothetical protein HDK77DRAFT_482710 [Phyllosticta capitalensis]